MTLKRLRETYNDFWAERMLIKSVPAFAGGADLSEIYRQEARFMAEVLNLSSGDTVLDLGCGTGGHCLAFAEQGIHATGIDIAPVLVEHASAQAGRTGLAATFVCADMRAFRPESRYRAVVTSSGTFGVYENDSDNRAVLRTIREALADDGQFLIGPSGPELLDQPDFSRKDWLLVDDGCLLRETGWDQATATFREELLFIDEVGTVHEFAGFDDTSTGQRSRVYSLQQLQGMIAEEGLVFSAAYGSFDRPLTPYGSDSPRLLIAGRRK